MNHRVVWLLALICVVVVLTAEGHVPRVQEPLVTCGDILFLTRPCRLDETHPFRPYNIMSMEAFDAVVTTTRDLFACVTYASYDNCCQCRDQQQAASDAWLPYFDGVTELEALCNGEGTALTTTFNQSLAMTCSDFAGFYRASQCCDSTNSSRPLTFPLDPVAALVVNDTFSAVIFLHTTHECLRQQTTFSEGCTACLANLTLSDFLLAHSHMNSRLTSVVQQAFRACYMAPALNVTSFHLPSGPRRTPGARANYLRSLLGAAEMNSREVNFLRASDVYSLPSRATSKCQASHFAEISETVLAATSLPFSDPGYLNRDAVVFIEFFGNLTTAELNLVKYLCSLGELQALRIGHTQVPDDAGPKRAAPPPSPGGSFGYECADFMAAVGSCASLRHLDFENCRVTGGYLSPAFNTVEGASLTTMTPLILFDESTGVCSPTLRYFSLASNHSATTGFDDFIELCYPQLCGLCVERNPNVLLYSPKQLPTVITPVVTDFPDSLRCPAASVLTMDVDVTSTTSLFSMVENRTFCMIHLIAYSVEGVTGNSFVDGSLSIEMADCAVPGFVLAVDRMEVIVTSPPTMDIAVLMAGGLLDLHLDLLKGSGPTVLSVNDQSRGSQFCNITQATIVFRAAHTFMNIPHLVDQALAGNLSSLEIISINNVMFVNTSNDGFVSDFNVEALTPYIAGVRSLQVTNIHLMGTIPDDLCSLPSLGTAPSDRAFAVDYDMQTLAKSRILPPGSTRAGIFDYPCIDLSGNRLSGTIPGCFSNLFLPAGCDYLDFGNNWLEGELPDFGPMRFLNVSHNNFTGPIPTTLAGSAVLDFSFTSLDGPIPTEIFTDSLTYLSLAGIWVSATLPTEIGLARNLRYLNLGDTDWGVLPDEMACLSLSYFIGTNYMLSSVALGNHIFSTSYTLIGALFGYSVMFPTVEDYQRDETLGLSCSVSLAEGRKFATLGSQTTFPLAGRPKINPLNVYSLAYPPYTKAGMIAARQYEGSPVAFVPIAEVPLTTVDPSLATLVPDLVRLAALEMDQINNVAPLDRSGHSEGSKRSVRPGAKYDRAGGGLELLFTPRDTYVYNCTDLPDVPEEIISNTTTGNNITITTVSGISLLLTIEADEGFTLTITGALVTSLGGPIDLSDFLGRPFTLNLYDITKVNGTFYLAAGPLETTLGLNSPTRMTLTDYVDLYSAYPGVAFLNRTMTRVCISDNATAFDYNDSGPSLICVLGDDASKVINSCQMSLVSDTGRVDGYFEQKTLFSNYLTQRQWFTDWVVTQAEISTISLTNDQLWTHASISSDGAGGFLGSLNYATGSACVSAAGLYVIPQNVSYYSTPTCDPSAATLSFSANGTQTTVEGVTGGTVDFIIYDPNRMPLVDPMVTAGDSFQFPTVVNHLQETLIESIYYGAPVERPIIMDETQISRDFQQLWYAVKGDPDNVTDILTQWHVPTYTASDVMAPHVITEAVVLHSMNFVVPRSGPTGYLTMDSNPIFAVPYQTTYGIVTREMIHSLPTVVQYLISNEGVAELVDKFPVPFRFIFDASGSPVISEVPYPRGYYDAYIIDDCAFVSGCLSLGITGGASSAAYKGWNNDDTRTFVSECSASGVPFDEHGLIGVCCQQMDGCCGNVFIPRCSLIGELRCPAFDPLQVPFTVPFVDRRQHFTSPTVL